MYHDENCKKMAQSSKNPGRVWTFRPDQKFDSKIHLKKCKKTRKMGEKDDI